jgi:hypothetical protein
VVWQSILDYPRLSSTSGASALPNDEPPAHAPLMEGEVGPSERTCMFIVSSVDFSFNGVVLQLHEQDTFRRQIPCSVCDIQTYTARPATAGDVQQKQQRLAQSRASFLPPPITARQSSECWRPTIDGVQCWRYRNTMHWSDEKETRVMSRYNL